MANKISNQDNWTENCLFPGKYFARESSLKEECFSRCISKPNCTRFTWFDNMCFMKSTPINPIEKNGFTCDKVTNKTRGITKLIIIYRHDN